MTTEADEVRVDTAPTGRGAGAVRAGRAEPGARRWVENRAVDGWLPRLDLAEAWASREIAAVLALRNIRIRYKQTFLGVAWALLQPLAAVGLFTLVFGRLADLPSEDIPYPVFVYAGLDRKSTRLNSSHP